MQILLFKLRASFRDISTWARVGRVQTFHTATSQERHDQRSSGRRNQVGIVMCYKSDETPWLCSCWMARILSWKIVCCWPSRPPFYAEWKLTMSDVFLAQSIPLCLEVQKLIPRYRHKDRQYALVILQGLWDDSQSKKRLFDHGTNDNLKCTAHLAPFFAHFVLSWRMTQASRMQR